MMVEEPGRVQLAVLGTPIAHSRSPQLQNAAYGALGLPWQYGRELLDIPDLAPFLASRDETWRGFSVTMPLKREALRLVASASPVAIRVGAVNTISLVGGVPHGWNTDVRGIVSALRERGITSVQEPWILGAGATATSAVAAVRELGARRVFVAARRADQVDDLAERFAAAGVGITAVPWERMAQAARGDLIVNTVPWPTGEHPAFRESTRSAVPLLEIVYDPWPTSLATDWHVLEGTVVSGLDMLLHQAIAQVRIFLTGDEHEHLPDEPSVLETMRAALTEPSGADSPAE
jgi:shikimate dehydrogenase